MRYVVLAVASDVEAERLVQDLTEYPDEPLRTPRWGNAVYAAVITGAALAFGRVEQVVEAPARLRA
ncbi:MAG TPA: hypothetical protein VFA63_19540 [Pseudonocardiaceae bacterium]|jgi:hypothetical protein|nr:hypothetical protein [Pseudonocardiaceae bacterium]